MTVNRRAFLSTAAGFASANAFAKTPGIPIIDTHVHLFDPTRPEGVPWPPKNDTALYRPALPDRCRKMAAPFGVTGAIAIEASPWPADNDWLLETAAKSTFIVGIVGDLEPADPDFGKHLERYTRSPLFRGIRYGNLWGRNLDTALSRPAFISGLKSLAQADLELDTANPKPALMFSVLRLSDKVPDLRIVIDHLPELDYPKEASARAKVHAAIKDLGKRPQIYVKLSEMVRQANRAMLDELWETFGEDRVLYGSDWPNSDHWATYATVFKVAKEYAATKPYAAREKFFWKNSIAAYKWRKREIDQPPPQAAVVSAAELIPSSGSNR